MLTQHQPGEKDPEFNDCDADADDRLCVTTSQQAMTQPWKEEMMFWTTRTYYFQLENKCYDNHEDTGVGKANTEPAVVIVDT